MSFSALSSPTASISPFVPTGTKKLELQVVLQNNPVILRKTQDALVVRGQVKVISREVQPLRTIHVLLTGTKLLLNAPQTSNANSATKVLINEEATLQHDKNPTQFAIGTYTLPFEFTVTKSLPPSLHAPHCTIEYLVVATALKMESAPSLLRMFSAKASKAQAELRLVGLDTSDDPRDLVAKQSPMTRIGTLGSNKNGRGALPYRVVMDKNVVAPGDIIRFDLDIYPPDVLPKFTPAEFAALIKLVESANIPRKATAPQDCVLGQEPTRPTDSGMASDDEDEGDATTVSNSLADSSSARLSYLGSAPPDHALTHQDTNDLALKAASAMVGNKSTVIAYKIVAKLVQHTSHASDHGRVDDGVWTKRVICAECVSECYDVTQKTMHLEWTLQVPSDLQHDLAMAGVEIRYDVWIDFYPREHRGAMGGSSIRDVVSRVSNHCLSSRMPLRTIPVSLSTMLANPLYSN
ncbi:hypothetical protein IW152_004397 [Coemansia sp. BCRC 34962]|nr:hypothetical protein IW152_004397 [Coemansia sp. BCRC 34962]